MSAVASIAMTICVVSIAGSLLSALLPEGSAKKIVLMVLGAFLLCSVIGPVQEAVQGFSLDMGAAVPQESITASADETYSEKVLEQTEKTLETTLANLLRKEEIKTNRIRITLKEDEYEGIIVSNISIYIDKKDNSSVLKIKEITEKNFGITPYVISEK